MTKEFRRIRFDEFAANLARFFKLVSHGHEPVVVENEEGERVVIRPVETTETTGPPSEDDYRAFRSAFGGWADVDTEALKEKIKESRKSSRPPISL